MVCLPTVKNVFLVIPDFDTRCQHHLSPKCFDQAGSTESQSVSIAVHAMERSQRSVGIVALAVNVDC